MCVVSSIFVSFVHPNPKGVVVSSGPKVEEKDDDDDGDGANTIKVGDEVFGLVKGLRRGTSPF